MSTTHCYSMHEQQTSQDSNRSEAHLPPPHTFYRANVTLGVIVGLLVLLYPLTVNGRDSGQQQGMAVQSRRPNSSSVSVRIVDDPLRSMAESTVLPLYPPSAIRKGQTGVAVARVSFQPGGGVQRVDVLEAPSPEIGQSVQAAVRQWRFRLPDEARTKGKMVTGILTFYFYRSRDGYRVAGPADAPNIRQ